jgi:hypothetical protein
MACRSEGGIHGRKAKARKSKRQKTKLGLPDLEQAETAVLVSLRSPESAVNDRIGIEPSP